MNIRRMPLFVVLLVTIVLLHGSTEIHCGGAATTSRKSLSVSKQQQQQQTPIKTIHTASGDIIDCIDIYKQPAFDNPLLKNHKIEMNPRFIREEKASVNSENMPFKNVKLFDKLQACPKGTVPIPRMPRRKQNSAEPNRTIETPPLVPLVRHYEVVETADGIAHYGVKGFINVNNPLVAFDQLSTAQIWVQSGPPEAFNLIEAGWSVYPSFYDDANTRLYTSWKGIEEDNMDCINYLCSSGFVQIDPALYLGITLDASSIYGGETLVVMKTEIVRHNESGNWWLTVHDIKLGYWPKELFNYLATNAWKVGFGAVTGAPPNRPGPQMGNGHLPNVVDLNKCGFIAKMKVVDIQGNENDIDAERLRIAGERNPCYQQNFRGTIDDNFRFTTTFGGPGGSCG